MEQKDSFYVYILFFFALLTRLTFYKEVFTQGENYLYRL